MTIAKRTSPTRQPMIITALTITALSESFLVSFPSWSVGVGEGDANVLAATVVVDEFKVAFEFVWVASVFKIIQVVKLKKKS
jgi:hypothetical protein